MKRGSKTNEHSDVVAHLDLMRELVLSVVAFMARTGMSSNAIRRLFQQSISRPQGSLRRMSGQSRRPSIAYGCDTIAGAVLRAWHKFPIYLNADARPICLRIDGPEPNLTALILSQDRHADANSVIRSMLKAGLLRKKGPKSFLPAKDAATIGSLDPLAVDHIAKTIMRLVETSTRNITNTRGKVQLIERYAHVPDLSRSEVKAFAEFSRQQGQACLDAVEDWLEARQTNHAFRTRSKEGGVNAGVHIFAYLGEPLVGSKRGSSAAKRRGTRPAPEARA
jgi:hypothetical protein